MRRREEEQDEDEDGEEDDKKSGTIVNFYTMLRDADEGILEHANVSIDGDSLVLHSPLGHKILDAVEDSMQLTMPSVVSANNNADSSRVLVSISHNDTRVPMKSPRHGRNKDFTLPLEAFPNVRLGLVSIRIICFL